MLKKGTVFYTADNTILKCPSASYKYNYGTYRTSKVILICTAVVGIVVSGILVVTSDSTKIQTIFATVIGGLINIIVWLMTSFVTDKMNHQRDELDRLISVIDHHISMIHKDVIIEDPDSYTIRTIPHSNINARFLWLLQVCIGLNGDPDIDTVGLELSWEGESYSLESFCSEFEKALSNHALDLNEKHRSMIEWNYNYLNTELLQLRDKMIRYKSYISSKKPPASYEVWDAKHNIKNEK